MLDKVNFRIVKALSQNARLTYAQIAKQVHLSAPAVAERIRKLEESGVITGYKPCFNLEKLGIIIPKPPQGACFRAVTALSVQGALEKECRLPFKQVQHSNGSAVKLPKGGA